MKWNLSFNLLYFNQNNLFFRGWCITWFGVGDLVIGNREMLSDSRENVSVMLSATHRFSCRLFVKSRKKMRIQKVYPQA